MSKFSGDNPITIGANIIIVGSQLLMVSKNIPDLLYSADLLVIDEVHGLKRGNVLNKAIQKFSTKHKFGLTGTLPDNKIDEWNIVGKIGPIIYVKDSASLRNAGYLVNVKCNILCLHYKTEPKYSVPSFVDPLIAYNEERDFIYGNIFRNQIIKKIVTPLNNNSLIVVDRLAHGEILLTLLTTAAPNKKVYFIKGSVEVADREKIRDIMENDDNIVCIAMAKIFSTGINIKNLHNIILAISGKAKVRLIQSIGRGLRLHENKDILNIFDISDQLKYGLQHEMARIKIYEQEQISYKKTNIYEK